MESEKKDTQATWFDSFDGTQVVAFAIAVGAVGAAVRFGESGHSSSMWSSIFTAIGWFVIFGFRRWRRRGR
jgi:hypothetical protein